MAALVLFRHGKSDWDAEPDGDDRLRPLARRGEKGASLMGRFLREAGHRPELALSSPARRAQDTLRIAQRAGGWDCEVRCAESLYSGGAPGLLAEVRAVSPDVSTLLVVGHEPTCSEVIAVLVGGCRLRFPTAAMACIELEQWAHAVHGGGSLGWLLTPRLVQAGAVAAGSPGP